MQIPLEDYVGNVQRIVKHVRNNLTPKLIFATSTAPHPDKPFSDEGWGWKQGDIERYNEAAKQVMAELGVHVNDLYGLVNADPDRMLCDDQLHLSEEGKKLCAEAVAKCLVEMLTAPTDDGSGSKNG